METAGSRFLSGTTARKLALLVSSAPPAEAGSEWPLCRMGDVRDKLPGVVTDAVGVSGVSSSNGSDSAAAQGVHPRSICMVIKRNGLREK